MRLRQVMKAGLAAIGLALAATAGQGAEPPTMTFELVEGHGPQGLTRWIQASGRIQPRTEADFEAFAARHDLTGLTLAVHSNGGVTGASERIARRIRALKLNTIVAQTWRPAVAAEPQALLVTSQAFCGSACVNLLAGGVERQVQASGWVAIHQVAFPVGNDGQPVRSTRPDGSIVDDSNYALYFYLGAYTFLREMGIKPQLMRLQASVASRDMRTLSPGELEQVGLARYVRLDDLPEGRPLWFINRDPANPGLLWRTVRVATPTLRIDEELLITCGAGGALLRYRVQPVRDTTGQSRTLTGMEIVLGSNTQHWSAVQGLALTDGGRALTRSVPLAALAEAAASGRLLTSASIDGVDATPRDLSDGFAAALAQLPATCRPPAEANAAPEGAAR